MADLKHHTYSLGTTQNFAKFNHFRAAILQNSAAPARFQKRNSNVAQKICEQELVKFGGNVAFLMRFGPFFYDKRKAGQDKMFFF